MRATIRIDCAGGARATLRIINDGTAPVLLHNAGNPQPTEGWSHSREAFRVAVLRSFGILALDVTDANGRSVTPRDARTNANYLAGVPLELEPGETFELPVPLAELFELADGTKYTVAIAYGDAATRISATRDFQCPSASS